MDVSSTATSFSSTDGMHLFNVDNLTSIPHWKEISEKLAAQNLTARPLNPNDYEKGYLELLSQLTEVGTISEGQFKTRFDLMKQVNQVREQYVIVVVEDTETKKIIAASTLFLELKFIHECALRGRLEEVAVLSTYRGRGIGEIIVRIIVELARDVYHCYKLSLDCTDDLKKFYAKNNFTYGSNMLSISFLNHSV